jgi:hypothetical protein
VTTAGDDAVVFDERMHTMSGALLLYRADMTADTVVSGER